MIGMKNSHTSSGWLSPRFWGVSFLFWAVYAGLQYLPAYFAYDNFKVLWLQSWPCVLYWLATPLLFECAYRLGRRGLSARGYYLGLFAAVLLAALFTTATFTAVYGPISVVVSMLVVYVTHYSAIIGVAAVVDQFRSAQLRRQELLAAQLRALRSQLQPHFLFNSLQAIAVTIKRDPKAAVGMVTLLGDLLRQTLRERSGELVSLQEEQELLQPYLELQRLRFADRLQIEVDMPSDVLGAAVPDLILQPLVENALQHGIESMPGKGSVRIRARRMGEFLELEVADDGVGPDRAEFVEGIGLGATRARLQALFGGRAELRLLPGGLSGAVVIVRMPWQEVSGVA